MRILNVGIDVPDFRPVPGIIEKRRGDIPQRVANLNDILIRMVASERRSALRKCVQGTENQ